MSIAFKIKSGNTKRIRKEGDGQGRSSNIAVPQEMKFYFQKYMLINEQESHTIKFKMS